MKERPARLVSQEEHAVAVDLHFAGKLGNDRQPAWTRDRRFDTEACDRVLVKEDRTLFVVNIWNISCRSVSEFERTATATKGDQQRRKPQTSCEDPQNVIRFH